MRAKALLLSHLNTWQQIDLEEEGEFEVTAPSGRLYRIYKFRSNNVLEIGRDGRTVCTFCLTAGSVPIYDQMLAQKLLIETDEAAFRKLANRHYSTMRIPPPRSNAVLGGAFWLVRMAVRDMVRPLRRLLGVRI